MLSIVHMLVFWLIFHTSCGLARQDIIDLRILTCAGERYVGLIDITLFPPSAD